MGLAESDSPLGTFLILGPMGVGKTELIKALSQRLFATEKTLVRIDMSEFREAHTHEGGGQVGSSCPSSSTASTRSSPSTR